jgi:predicted nucleotidyltransferase
MTLDPRIYEQFNAKAPFKLEDATILVFARIGSHSHGTYIAPTDPQAIDDTDFMGIIVPPPSYTIGVKNWDNTNFQFEELDCVFYSFRKFVQLLIKSNPNVIGLLWLRPEDYVQTDSEWTRILAHRDLFSSLMAYDSFLGYAMGQFKKMESFDLATQLE